MDYGIVKYKGKELTITQNPYINTVITGGEYEDVYMAHAIDDEENEYRVVWNIEDATCEDDSMACDWDKYSVQPLFFEEV
jgi:hypothetical protein